ncbi:MAG: multiheme c-type cytochrome [Planctomycetota bacterium]
MTRPIINNSILIIYVMSAALAGAEIFLPGMQPKEAGIEFAKIQQCKMCHGGTKNGEADPFFSWQGGMMAQAAKDPVFRAALAIAEQDVPGVGEYCFRCHTPRGWLEGRSTPSDGSALNREDMQGVSCDVCHRLVDPQSDRARELIEHIPPGYGNAMIVADPRNIVMGPYGDSEGVARPHQVEKSEYHASSKLCANCHNISNPLLAEDVKTQPPYAYGHIERTYSEWLLSDYANRGKEGTCQSCHYEQVEGGGQASRFGDLHRDYFVKHGPVGGSTWVQDVTWLLWKGQDMDKKAFEAGKKKALALLQTAATLDLTQPSAQQVKLRICPMDTPKVAGCGSMSDF